MCASWLLDPPLCSSGSSYWLGQLRWAMWAVRSHGPRRESRGSPHPEATRHRVGARMTVVYERDHDDDAGEDRETSPSSQRPREKTAPVAGVGSGSALPSPKALRLSAHVAACVIQTAAAELRARRISVSRAVTPKPCAVRSGLLRTSATDSTPRVDGTGRTAASYPGHQCSIPALGHQVVVLVGDPTPSLDRSGREDCRGDERSG
jgi:hypothetical protein